MSALLSISFVILGMVLLLSYWAWRERRDTKRQEAELREWENIRRDLRRIQESGKRQTTPYSSTGARYTGTTPKSNSSPSSSVIDDTDSDVVLRNLALGLQTSTQVESTPSYDPPTSLPAEAPTCNSSYSDCSSSSYDSSSYDSGGFDSGGGDCGGGD